jgi:hypothetical protein
VDDAFRGRGIYAPPAPVAAGAVPYGQLASNVNTLMTDEARRLFETNLPGYTANLAQQSSNLGERLRGEVSSPTIRLLQRQGAERGIGRGSFSNALWLQALGLESEKIQREASAEFSQQQADVPVPELFNPSSLFVPETLAARQFNYAQQGQRAGQQAAQQAQQAARTAAQWGPPQNSTTYSNFQGMGGGRW